MKDIQSNPQTNLIWIDLEFTGLKVVDHRITRLTSVITNDELEIVAEGPSIVIHQPEEVISHMNRRDRVIDEFFANGMVDEVRSSKTTEKQAEVQTLEFIKAHVAYKKSPICGSSVYIDKMFLNTYMGKLDDYFHYRLVDVSVMKTLLHRWHKDFVPYEKKDGHKPFARIHESINELQYYRKNYL